MLTSNHCSHSHSEFCSVPVSTKSPVNNKNFASGACWAAVIADHRAFSTYSLSIIWESVIYKNLNSSLFVLAVMKDLISLQFPSYPTR